MNTRDARTTYDAKTVVMKDGMTYRIWRVLNSNSRFMDIDCQRLTARGDVYKTDQTAMHFTTIAHDAIATIS